MHSGGHRKAVWQVDLGLSSTVVDLRKFCHVVGNVWGGMVWAWSDFKNSEEYHSYFQNITDILLCSFIRIKLSENKSVH